MVELKKNRRSKRLVFSVGILTTETSEQIRWKGSLQKLLENIFSKGSVIFSSRRT